MRDCGAWHNAKTICGMWALAACLPLTAAGLPILRPHGPLVIRHSARIAPGVYRIPVAKGQAAITLAGNNLRLDLRGVVIESGRRRAWRRRGVGVLGEGLHGVTITGGAIHGYRFNLVCRQCSRLRVLGTNLDASRSQRLRSTATHFDVRDWVDIFHLRAWRGYGAGLWLENVRHAWIEGVHAEDGQNGILLAFSRRVTLMNNRLSHNSGWGAGLFASSHNLIWRNRMDWDVRCEGRSYSAGCDSAGLLLLEGSDQNRILHNRLRHSGDGFFLSRARSGRPSDRNLIAYNDGSDSPHNAFECTFSRGNRFIGNLADGSDYGFWLGFSRRLTMLANRADGNRHDGVAIEHGQRNRLLGNYIQQNGHAGVRLFLRPPSPVRSRDYLLAGNHIGGNAAGVILSQTSAVRLAANYFAANRVALRLDGSTPAPHMLGNTYAGGRQARMERRGGITKVR